MNEPKKRRRGDLEDLRPISTVMPHFRCPDCDTTYPVLPGEKWPSCNGTLVENCPYCSAVCVKHGETQQAKDRREYRPTMDEAQQDTNAKVEQILTAMQKFDTYIESDMAEVEIQKLITDFYETYPGLKPPKRFSWQWWKDRPWLFVIRVRKAWYYFTHRKWGKK